MTERIAYTKPSITELEVAYATDAARNGWGAHCYDYIYRLERDFAAHLGVRHAIATSSCTGALHLGLAALGIGPGDEVILADTNWIASVAPVVHLGATPVLVILAMVSTAGTNRFPSFFDRLANCLKESLGISFLSFIFPFFEGRLSQILIIKAPSLTICSSNLLMARSFFSYSEAESSPVNLCIKGL